MGPKAEPIWAERLKQAVRQDPKKAAVLAVLVLVLGIMVLRVATSGRSGPRHAGAASARLGPGGGGVAELRRGLSPALQEWLGQPVPPVARNLFAIKLEYFPADLDRKPRNIQASTAEGFWTQLEKSLSVQADQRDKRETLIANYMAEASRLRPQSIIMGTSPKAMINGSLVGEGEVVASFRVVRIEARRIIVEREGIRLEIPM